MRLLSSLCLATALVAAPPAITELQPRGAQKGRPFELTVVGLNLGEGATVVSSLPATFTPLGSTKPGMESRYATFLVEPTGEWAVGVYPLRVKASNGLSNIVLFNVGAFPELTEEESRPGALPRQNDSLEKAQTLPSTPLTLNGTLMGPDRDVFRLQVKAGERRVFEVDARRAGSAVDPVIRVYDAAGKQIARSEDDPMIGLDARLDMTFPKEGFYYVEIHDARFSTQAQGYYRFKTGAYAYAADIFPLGGRRGESTNVTLSNVTVKADLASVKAPQTFVNLPDSPSLPLPFAVGDYPELREPVTAPLALPVTINGRLAKAAEVDKYTLSVEPGQEYLFELQARELGTSKLTGLITVYDEAGKKLSSAGDAPLPVDVAAVQASSRTLGDPFLQFKAPEGVRKITVAVEDLALRGGAHYAYRLHVSRSGPDFQAQITTPFVNIPAGGTALVNFNINRRGYTGPLRIEPINLPAGIQAAGGDIPHEIPDPNNRANSRRGMITLTAAQDARFAAGEIGFRVVSTDPKMPRVERIATGLGYAIAVNGATTQGVVDRQRALTGQWLGYQLPTALTDAAPAGLSLRLEKATKKAAGYEYLFRWRWTTRDRMQAVPENVVVDLPNFIDFRAIEMEVDKTDKTTGTFLVTSTRNTLPALYNIGIMGRLMTGGQTQEIYSPLLPLAVAELDPEEKSNDANPTPAR